MGVVSGIFHNKPPDRSMRQWLFPRVGKNVAKPKKLWAYFCAFPFPCLIAGWEGGMTGHYLQALLCFIVAGMSMLIGIYLYLDFVTRRARLLWAGIALLPIALMIALFYMLACPSITIEKREVTYLSKGDSFMFRITNHGDDDSYANLFLFKVDPSSYLAEDFAFKVDRASVRPLQEQPSNSGFEIGDIFALVGRLQEPSRAPSMLFYIYRLAPHESREMVLRFDGFIGSISPLVVRASVVSHTDKAIPASRVDDVVLVPMLMKNPFTIHGAYSCELSGTDSVDCFLKLGSRKNVSEGCYEIAFNYDPTNQNPLPNKINNVHCNIE
jgi:hypothetical protein